MGDGSRTGRLTRVRTWLTENATEAGLPVTIRLLCDTAVARLDVTGAMLTMENWPGWPETTNSTDLLGERLAELQVTVGEGPSVDARRDGGPVLVDDLDDPANQRRWPLFAPLAVEAGAGALFALPMCVGVIRVGVLALYRVSSGGLDPATLADALVFAELARDVLLNDQAGLPATSGTAASELSPHSAQIHQATGMISAQLGVGMEDAFARLRGRAFADQRPLAEVAAEVVARRLRFDSAGP
jgi:hypothetical protein